MDFAQTTRYLPKEVSCSQLGGCYRYSSKDSLLLRLHRGMHKEVLQYYLEKLGGSVEVEVEGEVSGIKLRGHVDLITARGNVLEFKTTARKGIKEEWVLQLRGYLMLLNREKGYIITVNPWGVVKTYEVLRDDEEVLRWIDFFFAPECGRCLKFKYCEGRE